MVENKIEKIGRLVRQLRKEHGVTQEQLAAVAGTGIRFIRELEQGKESCHIGKVLNVVAMLGMEVHINGVKL